MYVGGLVRYLPSLQSTGIWRALDFLDFDVIADHDKPGVVDMCQGYEDERQDLGVCSNILFYLSVCGS